MINRLPLDFRIAREQPPSPSVAEVATPPRGAKHNVMQRAAKGIGRFPVASLAAAFLSGLALGRWIKGT
jgi:hypothetical protein